MATYQDGASVARVRGADDKTLFSGRRTWVVTVDLSTSCHPAISEDSTGPLSVGRSNSQAPVTASDGSVCTNFHRHVAGSEPSHMIRGRRAPSVPFSCQPVFTVVHRTARSPYPGPADDSRTGPPRTCPSRSSTAGRPIGISEMSDAAKTVIAETGLGVHISGWRSRWTSIAVSRPSGAGSEEPCSTLARPRVDRRSSRHGRHRSNHQQRPPPRRSQCRTRQRSRRCLRRPRRCRSPRRPGQVRVRQAPGRPARRQCGSDSECTDLQPRSHGVPHPRLEAVRAVTSRVRAQERRLHPAKAASLGDHHPVRAG